MLVHWSLINNRQSPMLNLGPFCFLTQGSSQFCIFKVLLLTFSHVDFTVAELHSTWMVFNPSFSQD